MEKHVDSDTLLTQLRKLSDDATKALTHSDATELEVLRLFGQGYRRQEIAASLGLDSDSTEQLRVVAMQKRGLTTRSDVARFVAGVEAESREGR